MLDNKDYNCSNTVLRQIIQLIRCKELQPGEPISQRSIAKLLGVSTQPVAIAFKQLEEDGLIVVKPRCGTRLALLKPEEVWDSLQLRLAVEARALELVCANASDEMISELLPLAEQADLVDMEIRTLEADDRFHFALCEKAKSPALFDFLNKKLVIFRAKQFLCPALVHWGEMIQPRTITGALKNLSEHIVLYESIRCRDLSGARKLLEEHICTRGFSTMVENFALDNLTERGQVI